MTDNEKTIKDYLKIVDNNIECGWYDAALEYLEKILAIDYKCDQAWILKANKKKFANIAIIMSLTAF